MLTIRSIALVAALSPLVYQSASAQNFQGKPKPAISDYGPFKKPTFRNATITPAPGKCGNPAGPCLFYGGDFVFSAFYPNIANGLANETTTGISGTPYGSATWVPFTVPPGKGWIVSGLFTNNQSTYGVLDQTSEPESAAYWSINQSLDSGSGGTVIASGTSAATSTPTGRVFLGFPEYTVQVTGLNVTLSPGSYWLIVVPICTNTADPFCGGAFFLSDVEYINGRPTHAFAPPEPTDASFFDSPFFGFSFAPTYSPAGVCAGVGCDAFSAGVLGQKIP